jgi:hypothetical protein
MSSESRVTLMGNHPIQNMLYSLKGTDLISLAVSVILLLGIAILAGYFPSPKGLKSGSNDYPQLSRSSPSHLLN